jgi:hypothetical protein
MRINGWNRLGIVLSAAWLLVASWAYFYELNNHPSELTAYFPHAGYEWIHDLDATKMAHKASQQQGKDFSDRFVLLKPTFDTYGFLKFILTPIVASWLGIYVVLWIFRWVRRGFES